VSRESKDPSSPMRIVILNRRKPLNCWEIAEATLDFSFSKENV
jgi:hypothetical protein